MRKTYTSNAKNLDILHATALTSDVWNVMNTDISSWNALAEYLPQEHWHHTTRHTEIATPDQTQGNTRKTEKGETDPDHSLDTANIVGSAIVTSTDANPDHNNGTGTTTIEAAQDNPIQHSGDTLTGHTAAHQAITLRITVNHILDLPTNHQNIFHTTKDHTVQDHTPIKETESSTSGGVRRSR